ncbi:dihydrolipoyl dehydrogenase [Candidatus Izimaplasma bacterium ZiA1]|uniref:dihydrolipoyl dehydrogenase n=1 Tax=Candidatus Izimoplasma sp. ZiA1 TaxID=2024899 RepID=UPI00143B732B
MKDVVIIGAGPGGFDTAIFAAEHGLQVTLIEKHIVGGTCLNYGCIPTKTLYQNAKTIKNMTELSTLGVNVDNFTVDYEQIKNRKESIVSNQVKNILTSLKKLNVNLIEGEAKIINKNEVMVNDEIIKTKNIIIATGSTPRIFPFPGSDLEIVNDSKGILSLDTFPKKMIVVGAGVIGSEIATIFNYFDSEITLVEYMDEILPPLDKDIKKRAKNLYKRQGINILTSSTLKEVKEEDGKYIAIIESKGKLKEIETDYVLLATGRKPSFGNLDLDGLGIEYDQKGIKVNNNFMTSIDGVYAIGDVTGILMLAHKATYDGYKTISHILNKKMDINFDLVPSVVFSFPEIASIGKTEDEMNGEYKTNKYLYKTNAKAEAMNETDGFIKMIVDEDNILVGAHIIGAHAADLIHELSTIIYKKITINEYKNIIHAHPTLSEIIGECIKGFH